jgi:replicative DNA helicase
MTRKTPSTTENMANLDAEISILGSMILNNETVDPVTAIVRADDFTAAGHRMIFDAIVALHDQQKAIDLVTLSDELKGAGNLETVGGLAYLSSLAEVVPAPGNVEHYARIVRRYAQQREIVRKLDAARESIVTGDDGMDIARSLAGELCAFTASHTSGQLKPLRDAVKEWCAAQDAGRMEPAVATGFYDLDHLLDGGFHPGTLNLIAGRPSRGKTTLALNIAVNAAKAGSRVAFFSLEMSDAEIVAKIISASVGLHMHRLRLGQLRDEDRAAMADGVSRAVELPLLVDSSGTISVAEIAGRVHRQAVGGGLGLLVVDYLQLVATPQRRNATRNEEVGEISRGLKLLAKDLRLPVLAVSQLNRLGDTEKPRLSHLRDSGSLEQDADVVLFISSERGNTTLLDVAKNRMGPTGPVELLFEKSRQRFVSVARGSGDVQEANMPHWSER